MPERDFRMESVTAFVAVDPEDNSEGIMAMNSPGGWVPMIGADAERIESLRPMAVEIARASGTKEIRVVRFDQRVDAETIDIEAGQV